MTDWRETCDLEEFENSTHPGEWFTHWFLIVLVCGGAMIECAVPTKREDGHYSRFWPDFV